MAQFVCDICNYTTDKRGNYNRHLNTKKHKKKIMNIGEVFKCSLCNYVTVRRNNYLRHLRSAIHKEDEDEYEDVDINSNNINNLSNKIMNLNKDNVETENLITIQKSINKILEEQENLKKMIPKSGGNTIINNKLSINVYLNTECKKAMSIQDFLNQLKISLDDLNYTKNNGFVKGISNVFVKQLADLDPKERPIHCLNKKGLEFYIKNTHKWEKDSNNKNLNMAIGDVQKKQIQLLDLWDKENPGWENDERKSLERLKIAKSIYGSTSNRERDKENKLIRKKIGENIDLDVQVKEN
tara:strand:- start:16623 stop:17513 length:891 start_codon:yes stop_codon:yes gene_type:complete